jgi:hypothetical protein
MLSASSGGGKRSREGLEEGGAGAFDRDGSPIVAMSTVSFSSKLLIFFPSRS